MTVYIRPYVVATNHVEGCARRKCGPDCKRVTKGWEVDIVLTLPDGKELRERKRSSVTSKSGTKLWAERREMELLRNGNRADETAIPTLAEFVPRYMEEFCVANKQKPSTIDSKQATFDGRLLPLLGNLRLDEIGEEQVQRVKANMKDCKPKTINNVLCVLSKALKVAVRWRKTTGLNVMPVQIEHLKSDEVEIEFYEFEDYARLVESAEKIDPRAHLVVLLGGDGGLRTGEMIALEWSDIDFRRRQITIARSEWNGKVTLPKGGRTRKVPMTKKLAQVLKAHKHLRGPRVLYRDDGTSTSKQTLTTWMKAAQRRAGLRQTGNKHILRHTFCSHLAMRGATVIAIKELAGHRSLRTTMRYMHLSPDHKEQAIRLLDRVRDEGVLGDILETAQSATGSQAAGERARSPEKQRSSGVSPGASDLSDERGFVTLPGFEPGFMP